ncbi:hypothetical protein BN946_scf185044.g19 [Trametes cinnabarina]|uniref:SUN domain-containing protein n=1 Tax=Pycnoporus cinnabarinus TaxID=5643 RepID=A0A060S1Q2_PYCCI|nr:hypothetical protein BN946_scf185044.g19 [Trametes cinnabarina]
MPAPAGSQSRFDGKRFVLREDSSNWSSDPSHPRKLLRFASLNSVSSDVDEAELCPPLDDTHRSRISFLTSLAVALLAVSLSLLYIRGFGVPATLHAVLSLPSSSRLPWQPTVPVSEYTELTPAVKAAVEQLVATTIRAHRLAHRGRPDFALRANGGRVISTLTSGQDGFFTSREDDPGVAIDDDVHAGRCWRIHTLPSQLGIRLPRMIYPDSITVEHLPAEVALDVGEAPQNITLWGVVEGKHNKEVYETFVRMGLQQDRAPAISRGLLWAPLASFRYDVEHEDPVQRFPVSQYFLDNPISVGVVAVEISGNWGNGSSSSILFCK